MTSTTTAAAANTTGCLTCFGTGTDPSFGDDCSNCSGTGRKATAGVTYKPRFEGKPASDAQVSLLERLADDMRDLGATQEADHIRQALAGGELTGGRNGTASKLIDSTFKAKDAVRDAQRQVRQVEATTTQATLASKDIDEGVYVIGTVDAPEMVKVQRSQTSGNLYAKAYTVVEGQKGSFEYQPGLIKRVAAEGRKLTLEDAQAIGQQFGVCCDCGRLLTNAKSIARGIGPVCFGKY